jgi:Yip1 domain
MDLVARARNITLSPRSEWAVIAHEPADIGLLYTGYIALLAAVPLLAELVHFLALGLPIGIALRIGLRGYFSSMIEVAVVAFAAELLAPRFGGIADRGEAFKLATFAFTPFWLGGVFLLLPKIGGLLRLLCGIYGLYVWYLGIGDLMGVPAEQRIPYFALVVVAAIVIGILVGLVVGLLFGLTGLGTVTVH